MHNLEVEIHLPLERVDTHETDQAAFARVARGINAVACIRLLYGARRDGDAAGR